MAFRTALVLISCVTFAWTASAEEIKGRVVGVAHCVTQTLLTPQKEQIKVRLGSIDAPEKGQPYGNTSRQALADKVFQKDVHVLSDTKDLYGRTIGVINQGERNINREMVLEGHAWAYRQYLQDQYMIKAEEAARAARRGLWRLQQDQIQPPWEWRRSRKEKASNISTDRPSHQMIKASGSCGAKRYCKQMASCSDARFHLNTCGVATLDGDGDGVPCEALCM